jgi:CBS domain-containing protein
MTKTCRDVMTGQPVCCNPDDSAQQAAQLMKDQNVGSIPVCEKDSNRLAGIVTDRDIALKLVAEGRDPKNTPVRDLMTTEVFSCRPEDNLDDALQTMQRQQVRRIPVVDEERRILGIISLADIATRLRAPDVTAQVVAEISRPRTAVGGA